MDKLTTTLIVIYLITIIICFYLLGIYNYHISITIEQKVLSIILLILAFVYSIMMFKFFIK